MKYRTKYEYHNHLGTPRHVWSAIGSKGAVSLHISDHGEEHGEKYGERYSGGIETHYRYPPEHMRDRAPDHDECHVLKCPCWHDGSSMQATDYWIPLWLAGPNDHDRILEQLAGHAEQVFSGSESSGFGQLINQVLST